MAVSALIMNYYFYLPSLNAFKIKLQNKPRQPSKYINNYPNYKGTKETNKLSYNSKKEKVLIYMLNY